MKVVDLKLPVPPTLNHSIGTRGKFRFLTKEYKEFLWNVAEEWARKRFDDWYFDTSYDVRILLFFPTRRRCDIDNRVKPILDALTRAGVWKDDVLVNRIVVERCDVDKENPRSEVRIIAFRE